MASKFLHELQPGDRIKVTEMMAPGQAYIHGVRVATVTPLGIFLADGTGVRVEDPTIPIEMHE